MTDPFARTMRLLDETARIIRERDQFPERREVFNHMHWCSEFMTLGNNLLP